MMLAKQIKLLSLTEAIEEFIVISYEHRTEKLWTKAIYWDNIRTGQWKPNQIVGYEKAEMRRKFSAQRKKLLRERIYFFKNGKETLQKAIKIFNQLNEAQTQEIVKYNHQFTFDYRVSKAISDNFHLIAPYLKKETV